MRETLSSFFFFFLLKAGISQEFSNLFHLSDYYEQTKMALQAGKTIDPMYWIYYYDNYILASCINEFTGRYSLRSLCPEGIAELIEYDKKNGRTFTYTLQTYLKNNSSLAKTARCLFIQRNALLYRLRRIQEITKLKLDNEDTRLLIQLFFKGCEKEKIDFLNLTAEQQK